jgi:hypothetical protein
MPFAHSLPTDTHRSSTIGQRLLHREPARPDAEIAAAISLAAHSSDVIDP